jgi:hypothetical protein
MTTEHPAALHDQLKRAEDTRTGAESDVTQAALQLSRYVSDLVADGRLHDPSKLQWLADYVEVFNECWTAWQKARWAYRNLQDQLDAKQAGT